MKFILPILSFMLISSSVFAAEKAENARTCSVLNSLCAANYQYTETYLQCVKDEGCKNFNSKNATICAATKEFTSAYLNCIADDVLHFN